MQSSEIADRSLNVERCHHENEEDVQGSVAHHSEGVSFDIPEHPKPFSVWVPRPSSGIRGQPGDEDIHWFVGVALAVPLILCLFVALASGTCRISHYNHAFVDF